MEIILLGGIGEIGLRDDLAAALRRHKGATMGGVVFEFLPGTTISYDGGKLASEVGIEGGFEKLFA